MRRLAAPAARPRFGGVPLDPLTMAGALERLEEILESRTPHQVSTVNIDFVVRAQRDRWLMGILNRTAINLIDGMPLVWALRALGHAIPERVAGSDLVPLLLRRLALTGRPVYLLGGAPAVTAQAASRMLSDYPGLRLCGVESPPRRPVEAFDPETIARIQAAAPSLLLVALGNPKQEYWLDLHLSELQVPLAVGIGGTVDFLAGSRRRAPVWMQRWGLEWAMRLAQEPVRLAPRYARDSLIFAGLFYRERGGFHG